MNKYTRELKKRCKDCGKPIYSGVQMYIHCPDNTLLHIDCWEEQKKNVTVVLS